MKPDTHEAMTRLHAVVPFCEAVLAFAGSLENIASLEAREAELGGTVKRMLSQRDAAKAELADARARISAELAAHETKINDGQKLLDRRVKDVDVYVKDKTAAADLTSSLAMKQAHAVKEDAKREAAAILVTAKEVATAEADRITSENHGRLRDVREQHDELVAKLHATGQELTHASEALGNIHAAIDAFRAK